jgi:hypothetical protein
LPASTMQRTSARPSSSRTPPSSRRCLIVVRVEHFGRLSVTVATPAETQFQVFHGVLQ